MIKVVAKQFIKKGMLEEFLPVARLLVEETNKKDAGCIRYEMYQDLNDPLIVTVIEEWESQEVLDSHMKASHFVDNIPKINACCEKPAEINIYKKLF